MHGKLLKVKDHRGINQATRKFLVFSLPKIPSGYQERFGWIF